MNREHERQVKDIEETMNAIYGDSRLPFSPLIACDFAARQDDFDEAYIAVYNALSDDIKPHLLYNWKYRHRWKHQSKKQRIDALLAALESAGVSFK